MSVPHVLAETLERTTSRRNACESPLHGSSTLPTSTRKSISARLGAFCFLSRGERGTCAPRVGELKGAGMSRAAASDAEPGSRKSVSVGGRALHAPGRSQARAAGRRPPQAARRARQSFRLHRGLGGAVLCGEHAGCPGPHRRQSALTCASLCAPTSRSGRSSLH